MLVRTNMIKHLTLLLVIAATPVAAQEMDHGQMDHGKVDHGNDEDGSAPFVPSLAEGSGTSRLPGSEGGQHSGLHVDLGDEWMGMAHGYVWGVYTDQSGPRGDSKAYVQSMAMASIEKQSDWGRIQLKSMMSLEPLMKNSGYPNLFATGETNGGEPLVDRQHPHDLFMELAVRVDIDIADDTRLFVYGGPVGEPALGPSAFMHRASARYNPEAPITHHWFDSNHITYGVGTFGLASSKFQVEASLFTGREPDERRWNIEKPRFDSWSIRSTWTPSPQWALQFSTGRLKQPEFLIHPDENEERTTASVHYAKGTDLSAMIAFSAKDRRPGPTLTAWMAEANWRFADKDNLFGRIENVRNDELFPDDADPLHETPFRITKLQIGYARTIMVSESVNLALGGTLSTFLKPSALDAAYGKTPFGATVFARFSLGR